MAASPLPAALDIVVVGDGAVGKTSFLMAATNSYTTHPVFETYSLIKKLRDERSLQLHFRDTGGQEDFDKVRAASYPGVQVALVFYSVISPPSFEHVTSKWLPELRAHAPPDTPVVLVGTKKDLRTDAEILARLQSRGWTPISTDQGQALAKEIRAARFVEVCCSSHQELSALVDDVLRVGLGKGGKRLSQKCEVL